MKYNFLFFIIIATLLVSCVTKKQFTSTENSLINCNKETSQLKAEVKSLIADKVDLSDKVRKLERDTGRINNTLRQTKALLTETQNLLNANETVLSEKMNELNEREINLNNIQDEINKQKLYLTALSDTIQKALLGYETEELTISTINGKIHISISDKLLFKSGSATLDKRGKTAILFLADVLKSQPNIDIEIEGHTDSEPINTIQFKDNLDLSVLRATSVARLLIEFGINPQQVIPSGRGDQFPIADNSTPEGRAKNRRTEIILSPKLDKLFELLNP